MRPGSTGTAPAAAHPCAAAPGPAVWLSGSPAPAYIGSMESTLTLRTLLRRPVRAAGFELPAGATLALRAPLGTTIAVAAGRVWLTEAGDPADHFVGAGQRHVVGRAGQVVMECVSAVAAHVQVGSPAG